MEQRTRVGIAVVATVCLFLTVQLGALALAPEFEARGGQTTADPSDPGNSVNVFVVILLATAGMLLLIRFGGEQVIRGLVLLTSGFLSWYVLGAVLPKLFGGVVAPGTLAWVALGGGVAVLVGLLVHPEWYVIDAAGVLMGAGAAGLFGINFGLLPALVLLVVLAVYDAISVYGTEHMLTLAEGVMGLRIPVLLVIPTSRSFSMDDLADAGAEGAAGAAGEEHGEAAGADRAGATGEEHAEAAGEDRAADAGEAAAGDDVADESGLPEGAAGDEDGDEEPQSPDPLAREALFIGLGDAVIPAVLVASSGFFLQQEAAPLVSGFVLNVPALGAMVGTIAGLLGLLYLVLQGRPHAGLPLLNGGAIAGYLVGALAAGVPLATALGL